MRPAPASGDRQCGRGHTPTVTGSAHGERRKPRLAFLLVVVVWRAIRRPLVRRLVRRIPHYPLDVDERLELPLGARLQAFGEAMGEAVREGEDEAKYLRRVFGVHDAFYGERPFWRLSEGPPP